MTEAAKSVVCVSPAETGETFSAMDEVMIIRAQFEGWTAFEMAFGSEVKVPAHCHPWAEVYFTLAGGMCLMVDGVEHDAPLSARS